MILFAKPGKENTMATVEATITAARSKKITQIVIASTHGDVAKAFLPYAKEFNIVCVGHTYYYRPEVPNSMSDEVQAELREGGIKLLFGSHLLSGVERSFSGKFQGAYPVEIIAHTLRMFGAGTKVCVECTAMALDAGLITPAITLAVGGTGSGADTALTLSPAGAMRLLDIKIHEYIAKPSFYPEILSQV